VTGPDGTVCSDPEKARRALLKRLRPLIDADCGVLREPQMLVFPSGHQGSMHGYSVTVGRPSALHPELVRAPGDLAGHGTSWDESTARIRASCEALERYCSTMYPASGILQATARELGDDALDPRRLPQCSARERQVAEPEYRLRTPDITTVERWVEGFSLTRGKKTWLPLTAVYMGLPEPLSSHLVFPESTGFAAGSSYDDAILSALCEAIERDSLALWWLHQLPMPRIEAEDWPDPVLAELIDQARRAGIRTHLFDLTSDLGVPVVGAVQTTAQGSPRVIAMGACRLSGASAALRVVEEAASLRVALAWSRGFVGREVIQAGTPLSPMQFGLLYADDDGPERFSFATRDAPVRPSLPAPIAGSDSLNAIVNMLGDYDMEVFVADVTQPEIRDVGLVVVRVIVPELMRISFSHGIRYLGHPRLYEAPEKMGYGRRTEDMVTDDPIPFA
jgi:ribosomal protein S12 methylthiotransferase accessory factor